MLSVCTTVKNRSRISVGDHTITLFPNLIQSLRKALAITRQDAELVVADWNSDDWRLHEWIGEEIGQIPTRVIDMPGAFSRGAGRNAAADAATGSTLVFLDADMLVSPLLMQRCEEVVRSGRSYFPVCFSFKDTTSTTGWWRWTGKGNCAVARATFGHVRWMDTQKWGGEDLKFHNECARITEIVREEVEGFRHQWHPTTQTFKNQFAT